MLSVSGGPKRNSPGNPQNLRCVSVIEPSRIPQLRKGVIFWRSEANSNNPVTQSPEGKGALPVEAPGPHPQLSGVQSLAHPSTEPPAGPGEEILGVLVTPGTEGERSGFRSCMQSPTLQFYPFKIEYLNWI